MATFAPTAIRASEMARCYRMAALRGIGAAHEEHDDLTRRYFARGHMFTDYVCRQLEAKYGKANVQREVEIEWPLGVGHADAYVIPEKLLVEIKSTVTPTLSVPMVDMAIAQTRFYLRFHPTAEVGALYLINPSDLRGEDMFEVRLRPEDIEEIDAAVAATRAALDGGRLPERVCAYPGQARSRLCPFAEACFDGWVAPDPDETGDPEVAEIAGRIAAYKTAERPLKEELAALEQARKVDQADLADRVEVGETVAGPWLIKRTHIQRSPSFSTKLYEAAGHSLEPLAEFFRPGAEYDTWKVSRAEGAGDIDFGEESPF